jgi:metallo-beta-lactamase class B
MKFIRRGVSLIGIFLISLFPRGGFAQDKSWTVTDSLEVVQIAPSVWQHITLQYYPAFGTFTSNGLIYRSGNEAVIMDTPASEQQSRALLKWLAQTYPDLTVKAVITNHFHEDALGGLAVFHKAGIDSYGHHRTKRLLLKEDKDAEPPRHSFKLVDEVHVGAKVIINFYPGPAHTDDNIVSWIPEERILFGGCMVKSIGANKGNVADANLKNWSRAIRKVLKKFPDAKLVVPGHGPVGDASLLEYTADLFDN